MKRNKNKCVRCGKHKIHRKRLCLKCSKSDNKKYNSRRKRTSYMVDIVEGEVWRDILGFEGYYMISNIGRVKSVKRYYSNSKRTSIVQEKIRKLTNDRGYLKVNLYINGEETKRFVHRLVAEAFIPNPNNHPDVNHLFGVKNDNRVSKLEWATEKENMDHAKRELGHDFSSGIRHKGKTHIQSKKVKQIDPNTNKTIKIWDCVSDVRRSGIAGSVSMCANGKLNTSGGYKWEYI